MFILRYKSIPILLLLFFIFIPHSSNAQQFENARSYFSFIDSHNAKIVEQTWYYMAMGRLRTQAGMPRAINTVRPARQTRRHRQPTV